MAPATKYGGKIVVCQPGSSDVAKSMLTMECTERTSGVANPANTRLTISYRAQVRCDPFHPRLSRPKTNFLIPPTARSRRVARSGIIPRYQKTSEMVRYVLMAKTSHTSGERKFTHRGPR